MDIINNLLNGSKDRIVEIGDMYRIINVDRDFLKNHVGLIAVVNSIVSEEKNVNICRDSDRIHCDKISKHQCIKFKTNAGQIYSCHCIVEFICKAEDVKQVDNIHPDWRFYNNRSY